MKDSNSSQQFVFVKSNDNKNNRNFRTEQQTQENDSFGNQSESSGGKKIICADIRCCIMQIKGAFLYYNPRSAGFFVKEGNEMIIIHSFP